MYVIFYFHPPGSKFSLSPTLCLVYSQDMLQLLGNVGPRFSIDSIQPGSVIVNFVLLPATEATAATPQALFSVVQQFVGTC
jgi:hypothetical protein